MLSDGSTVLADDAYLRRSIMDPKAQIVSGFAAVMPSFDDVDDEEAGALIAYIDSLGQG